MPGLGVQLSRPGRPLFGVLGTRGQQLRSGLPQRPRRRSPAALNAAVAAPASTFEEYLLETQADIIKVRDRYCC